MSAASRAPSAPRATRRLLPALWVAGLLAVALGGFPRAAAAAGAGGGGAVQPMACGAGVSVLPGVTLLRPATPAPARPCPAAGHAQAGPPSGCTTVPGANDRCPLWASDAYDGPGHGYDQAGSGLVDHVMASSPDGRLVYVAGLSQRVPAGSPGLQLGLVTVAVAADSGRIAWTFLLPAVGGFANGNGNSLAVSPDGDLVYVAGFVADSGYTALHWVVVALDAHTGQQRWVTGPPQVQTGLFSAATSVVVSPDGGRVYVVGYSFNRPTGPGESGAPTTGDGLTVAYDAASGTPLWQADYATPAGRAAAVKVRLPPDGSLLYVAGSRTFTQYGIFQGLSKSLSLLAYNPATGALVRASDYQFDQTVGPGPVGFALSPDGSRAFMTTDGLSVARTNTFLTVGFDLASGALLWSADEVPADPAEAPGAAPGTVCEGFNGPWGGTPIASSPDGARVYVVGTVHGTSCDRSAMATVAYDAAGGQKLWATAYAPLPEHDNCLVNISFNSGISLLGCSLAVGSDDRIYAFGNSDGRLDGSMDVSAVVYEGATGQQVWQARYVDGGLEGINTDVAPAGALSPDQATLYLGDNEADVSRQDATDIVVLAYATGAAPPAIVPEWPLAPAAVSVVIGAAVAAAARRRRRSRRQERHGPR